MIVTQRLSVLMFLDAASLERKDKTKEKSVEAV